VASVFVNENGWGCAAVDFGRGYVVDIFQSELSPIRIVAFGSPAPVLRFPGLGLPARAFGVRRCRPDSVEGQFRSQGKSWERVSGPIQVGIYVEDIWPNRLNQAAGRGLIGKVAYMHPGADGKSRAMVDFGRGYVVDIYPTELSPIRIVASEIPARRALFRPGQVLCGRHCRR